MIKLFKSKSRTATISQQWIGETRKLYQQHAVNLIVFILSLYNDENVKHRYYH